jgi:hypothetical protein
MISLITLHFFIAHFTLVCKWLNLNYVLLTLTTAVDTFSRVNKDINK